MKKTVNAALMEIKHNTLFPHYEFPTHQSQSFSLCLKRYEFPHLKGTSFSHKLLLNQLSVFTFYFNNQYSK